MQTELCFEVLLNAAGLLVMYVAHIADLLWHSSHAGFQKCVVSACLLVMQIADLLTQLVTDTDVTMEVSSFAAVALGLTFVGTCHAASVEAMLHVGLTCCTFTRTQSVTYRVAKGWHFEGQKRLNFLTLH